MPYRRYGEALHAETALGRLTVTRVAGSVEVAFVDQLVRISDRAVIVHALGRTERTIATTGRIIIARSVPHGELALWAEVPNAARGGTAMRRVFGIPRISDDFTRELCSVLRTYSRDGVVRAFELGADHPMLLVERADQLEIYGTRVFRVHAPLVLTLHRDGRVVFAHETRELAPSSELSINPCGSFVRFSHGADRELAQLACPWLAASERAELARRLASAVSRR